jgi:type I site-specific restriction-modification system R (restriction) subunit
MVEYETEKPLVVRFDRIFDYKDGILGSALAQVGYKTIIQAMKGLDTRSKEKILLALPEWMEEKVHSELEQMKEMSQKGKFSFSSMTGTKLAQQHIVDTMIAIDRKDRKNNTSPCIAMVAKA